MKLKQFVKDSGGVTKDFHQIDPRELRVRPDFNIRDLTTPAAREKLDILKAQIKAEGVLEALEIEFDGTTPWINEGHRRHLVVMELIAEGEAFKTIPCVQERQGTDPAKRNLHMLMRKKEDYEPLEYAAGVARQINVYGWDKADLARDLGFESKASIDRYLEMLGMTDAVKEQVASGVASATLALKVTRDTRDAKTDPKFAAEILAAAAAEQKALGKKSRATPKAVKRVSERAKPKSDPKPASEEPKSEAPAEMTGTKGHSPLSEERPPVLRTLTDDEKAARAAAMGDAKAREAEEHAANESHEEPTPLVFRPLTEAEKGAIAGTKPIGVTVDEVHEQLQTSAARERGPIANGHPPGFTTKKMIEALGTFAQIAEDNGVGERDDNDLIEVPVHVLKRGWEAYSAAIGEG